MAPSVKLAIVSTTGEETSLLGKSACLSSSFLKVYEEAQDYWLPTHAMDLIHYSFVPLILFRIPYMLDLLPYNLSIANGAGSIGIFELLIFQCFV